jgi:hypothetical protein
MVNTFSILDNVDLHPAADRLLLNLIQHAAEPTRESVAPLPGDFPTLLKELGYAD